MEAKYFCFAIIPKGTRKIRLVLQVGRYNNEPIENSFVNLFQHGGYCKRRMYLLLNCFFLIFFISKLKVLFRIASSSSNASVTINTVFSDGISTMHIQRHQKFFIEYDELAMRRSHPLINFKVDYEGELYLAPDFHVSGLINPALELNGRITGVANLTITENRLVTIGRNASSALIKKGKYTEEPVDGHFVFEVLVLESGSRLPFEKNINLEADTLYMRKNTLLTGNPIVMTCGDVHLEGGSNITNLRQGPKAGEGISPGIALKGVGSGGGHGGQGGPSVYTNGSAGYGSYIYPLHPGSGGGGSNGGRGGSTIKVPGKHQL